MKKTIRTLLLAAMCCTCIAGAVACGNNNDSTVTPPDSVETKSFRALSELEFYNWQDAKDVVVGYENAEVSDVNRREFSFRFRLYRGERKTDHQPR